MPKASVKRSIECNKSQLIDLVLDIEKYPIFVPFCLDSKVYEKKEKGDLILIVADLTIGKGPFTDTYKSNVQFNKKKDSLKDVKKSLNKRTLMDKKRKNSPLIKVKDAVLIRTDKLSKKEVLSKMSKYIERLN